MLAGVDPDLFLQLAAGRLLGRLALDVTGAGRDLEQVAVDGPPVLAHEQDVAAVGDGHHGHGPRMADDVAGELGSVGGGEARLGQADPPAPEADGFPQKPEPRRPTSAGGGPRPRRQGSGDDTDVDVDVEQAGQAALGPGQGRAQEGLEERMGPVGPALELGMGLGARPRRDGRAARRTRPGGRRARCRSRRGRRLPGRPGTWGSPRSGGGGVRRRPGSRRPRPPPNRAGAWPRRSPGAWCRPCPRCPAVRP